MSFFTEVNHNSKRHQAWTTSFSQFLFSIDIEPFHQKEDSCSPVQIHHASAQSKIGLKAPLFLESAWELYKYVKSTVAADHSKHLTRKKRTNPPPSVGRFYVSFSNVSHEYSGHLSLKTTAHAYPPRKKWTVYATGHPQKVSCQLHKCDIRTLWPLVTQNKGNSIPTEVMKKETYSVG